MVSDKLNNLSFEDLEKISSEFKALSDTSRIKIILFLLDGEKSVNAIAEKVNLTQPATSHHLRVLKNVGILNMTRIANENYYRVADEHISAIIKTAITHLSCED